MPLEDAFAYAAVVHAAQRRKGTQVPYIAHLLAVAALVLEDGGSEEEAIAGLLHDAAEDAGGEERLADIEKRFGPRVAEIVRECSDTFEDPKPPWPERKATYLYHLHEVADAGILRVSLADKVHNTRTILADLRAGEPVFCRLKATKEGTLWNYRELHDCYLERCPGKLERELGTVLDELERIVQPDLTKPLYIECSSRGEVEHRFPGSFEPGGEGRRTVCAEKVGLAFLIEDGSGELTVQTFRDVEARESFVRSRVT